jgi:hypothetical protein
MSSAFLSAPFLWVTRERKGAWSRRLASAYGRDPRSQTGTVNAEDAKAGAEKNYPSGKPKENRGGKERIMSAQEHGERRDCEERSSEVQSA